MSDESDSSLAAHVSQDNSGGKCQPNTTDELIRLGCCILRVILLWITSETAHRIARRVENLSRASFVPDSGHGNNAAGAFLLDMTSDSFKHLASRRNIPKTMPGDESLYRFADITKTFESATGPDQPGEKLRIGCAKKKPSVSTRPKPNKK